MALLGPSTDYTDKDFDSLRARLIQVIPTAFPGWTDFDVADFANLLVELFCFIGDVLTKYQDNQAAEAFFGRVTQRKNIIALCKLIGFVPRGATASRTDVSLTLDVAAAGDVTIPARTRVSTEQASSPVVFETLADVTIDAGLTGPVVVTAENALAQAETFASSGKPNQAFKLSARPYLDGSLTVTAANGSFTLVENLLDSTSLDRDCYVSVDQDDRATLVFGNGAVGVIPVGTINVGYKTGGGTGGKVDAGTLRKLPGTFTDSLGHVVQVRATNAAASSTAVDRQSVEEIRLAAPEALRVLTRTVAREDFEINARAVAGVARALMLSSDQDDGILENQGILFVVPVGGGTPTSDLLAAVLTEVTVTKPCTLTFHVDVQAAVYKTVDVAAKVFLAKGASAATVRAAILDRLARAFAVQTATGDESLAVGVDFGFNLQAQDPEGAAPAIAWSDVFDVVRDTAGVRKVEPADGLALNGIAADLALAPREFPVLGTVTLTNADTAGAL
jgi:hypothetical protein